MPAQSSGIESLDEGQALDVGEVAVAQDERRRELLGEGLRRRIEVEYVEVVIRAGVLFPPLSHDQRGVAFYQRLDRLAALLFARANRIDAETVEAEMLVDQGMPVFMGIDGALNA